MNQITVDFAAEHIGTVAKSGEHNETQLVFALPDSLGQCDFINAEFATAAGEKVIIDNLPPADDAGTLTVPLTQQLTQTAGTMQVQLVGYVIDSESVEPQIIAKSPVITGFVEQSINGIVCEVDRNPGLVERMYKGVTALRARAHTHANADTLNRLSSDGDGHLIYDGEPISSGGGSGGTTINAVDTYADLPTDAAEGDLCVVLNTTSETEWVKYVPTEFSDEQTDVSRIKIDGNLDTITETTGIKIVDGIVDFGVDFEVPNGVVYTVCYISRDWVTLFVGEDEVAAGGDYVYYYLKSSSVQGVSEFLVETEIPLDLPDDFQVDKWLKIGVEVNADEPEFIIFGCTDDCPMYDVSRIYLYTNPIGREGEIRFDRWDECKSFAGLFLREVEKSYSKGLYRYNGENWISVEQGFLGIVDELPSDAVVGATAYYACGKTDETQSTKNIELRNYVDGVYEFYNGRYMCFPSVLDQDDLDCIEGKVIGIECNYNSSMPYAYMQFKNGNLLIKKSSFGDWADYNFFWVYSLGATFNINDYRSDIIGNFRDEFEGIELEQGWHYFYKNWDGVRMVKKANLSAYRLTDLLELNVNDSTSGVPFQFKVWNSGVNYLSNGELDNSQIVWNIFAQTNLLNKNYLTSGLYVKDINTWRPLNNVGLPYIFEATNYGK